MKGQHYALIEKEGCDSLEISSTLPKTSGRTELEAIYQTYADLYPSPRLLEEKRETDTLLQAARAASSVRQETAKKSNSRKGFFTFLFGSREEPETTNVDQTTKSVNDFEAYTEDNQIQYTDIPNEYDDGSLCGTQQSLDVTCIPPEVYNVARSHLTSTLTRRENPNALKWGPGSRLLTQQHASEHNASSTMFVVVGLGEIAEFGGTSRVLQTSDRDELAVYAQRTRHFDLSAVRGTILSSNCLAISWGFLDGITVVYRRKISFSNTGGTSTEGWEAVWWIGPSEPILDNLANDGQDLYMDDSEQPGSALLKITDCVGLHVPSPVANQEGESALVAMLVVSRLGGYIELVPLPIALWRGPILERNEASRKPKRKQQNARHYAAGRNIVCPSNTLALTTFEYHLDVQALDIYRTSVDNQTMWDNEKYPDGPPAEFLLVASGVSVDGGHGETMTFWAISTLFASNEEETIEQNALDDFQIHSRLLEAIWTGTGAPISTFATPGIMSRWRTPKHVQLKETSFSANEGKDDIPSPKALAPVTTLSTTAPIVSMKFSDKDGSLVRKGPFLSVLDWNGGVQVFDCSVVARLAGQTLTREEYEHYKKMNNQSDQQQEQPPVDFHLVKCIMLRSQLGNTLQKFSRVPAVKNMQWLESAANDSALPSLVFFLKSSKKLLVFSFDLHKDRHVEEEPFNPSIISIPFPVAGAAMECVGEKSLSFVSLRIGSSKAAPVQRLRYFVMEQLQPMAIVETLARESKFEEAIQSASKLSKDQQEGLAEVVVSCHRHLWETKRDSDSLIATNDELYILNEVLSICATEGNETEFSLEDLRSLLKLALDTVSSNREEVERVRKAFLRLGTYELLCNYYESNPTLKQFRNEFLPMNMMEFSFELARRGDIPALSMVFYRHRLDVHDKLFHILGSLPLAMNSASFCHLLPIIRHERRADLFLDLVNGEISELPWSHMPQYILEKYLVPIAFDRFDEMAVLECNRRSNDRTEKPLVGMVVDWFVKRANRMQTFVGNVEDVVSFTKIGMRCVSACSDENDIDSNISSFQELQTTSRTASSLKRMLLDEAISIDGDGINTDDLNDMDLVELLDLVLDCGDESSVVHYRFNEYIQPLAMELSVSTSSDHLDESLATYCTKKAKHHNKLEVAEANDALVSVLTIAEISKASLPKKSRLIKNKAILIDMILDIISEISEKIDVVELSLDDKRGIVESFWSLYQTLPERLGASEAEYNTKLQKLHDDLVGVDILSRWPDCDPFLFFNMRQSKQDEETTFQEGNPLIVEICESFNSVISVITDSQDQVSLLQDLLSDVKSLNKIVFKDSLDFAKSLCECLVPSFLEKRHFGLVASFLGYDESVVDRKQVLRNVIQYVDEAMFSGDENMNRITNVMNCQDALEPLLPEIQSLFQSNRRYLDASHFLSTVLVDGKLTQPLTPSDLKEMAPLDVLEIVLREFPECIGCRCTQWLDPEYAESANKSLRQAETMGEQENNQLPELPGGAVFHLATILGLESNISALAVKSRVIHHALQAGFYGAGAAIARTLLHHHDAEPSTNITCDAIKVGAIADVVSVEKYHDVCTKKELCDAVLRGFDKKVSFEHNESFNTILRVSSKLDFVSSRFDHEARILSPERKKYLLSRPIARVHHHTFHEYNRDMHCLFKDLANQSSDGLVHDSLMDVLSRFIFFWLIHDSITTKNVINLMCKADAEENLKLACGLLLQIPSTLTAENSLSELQEIALTQSGRVASEERFEASNTFIVPHPDILRHLVQRGFTENAARRAATMTGNAGKNEAMAWAVGHAMDSGINSPLVMLKTPNRKMIDEGSIQVLQKSLIQLSNILQDPISRSAFLQNLTNRVPIGKDSNDFSNENKLETKPKTTNVKAKQARPLRLKKVAQKSQPKVTENEVQEPQKNRTFDENGMKEPASGISEQSKDVKPVAQQRKKPPPPPPRHARPLTTNNAVTKSKEEPVNGTSEVGSKDPVPIVKRETKNTETPKENSVKPIARKGIVVAPTSPEVPPKISSTIVKPRRNETVVGNEGIASKSIKTTRAKPTPKFTMDREELRRRGKAALDKLKGDGKETPAQRPKAVPTGQEATKSPAVPTPSRPRMAIAKNKRAPIDREALLKRGQEALNKLRSSNNNKPQGAPFNKPRDSTPGNKADDTNNSNNNSSSISRRRLIEEGRQLLLQSKNVTRGKTFRSPKPPPPRPVPPPPKPKASSTPQPDVTPASKPPPSGTASTEKAVKLTTTTDDEDNSAGWDFDDFDDF